MRENRPSGSEGGAGEIPVPTPIFLQALPGFRADDGRRVDEERYSPAKSG